MAEPDDDGAEQEAGVKRTKHRSPNYPAIGLETAVQKVKTIHDKFKRAQVPINIAQEEWGFRAHGGTGNQTVAALKAYGLFDVEGDGKNRRVRVSDAAYRILLGSPDKPELLKKAAIAPALHKELWDRFADQDFPEELVRHYLLFDREDAKFNSDTVGGFIDDFRASLQYAGLLSAGIIPEDDGEPETPLLRPLTKYAQIGDRVQVVVGGKYQFKELRAVQGVSDDGEWIFIEGMDKGVPKDQVLVMETSGEPVPRSQMPPLNPYTSVSPKPGQDQRSPPAGFKEAVLPLHSGAMVVRWPERLSPDEVQDVEDWIPILVRKMKRAAQLPAPESE
jgi:hypothetical protein